MTPPWEPPLAAFFTPAAGVPEVELHAAIADEGGHRDTLSCGYNCVLIRTTAGDAVIDTGLGARFLGYGPRIEPLVGRLGDGLASAGAPAADIAAVVFTHLHQDHSRGATWSGELTFPLAAGFAHTAEVAFWSGARAAAAAPLRSTWHPRARQSGSSATGCARSTMTTKYCPASAPSTPASPHPGAFRSPAGKQRRATAVRRRSLLRSAAAEPPPVVYSVGSRHRPGGRHPSCGCWTVRLTSNSLSTLTTCHSLASARSPGNATPTGGNRKARSSRPRANRFPFSVYARCAQISMLTGQ